MLTWQATSAGPEPEDEWGAARSREYKPQGHPRTEAGEETIIADKPLRRALQHGMGRQTLLTTS